MVMIGRLFITMKKINQVKCTHCEWRLSRPEYDSQKEICYRCKNTRLMDDPKEILCNMCGGLMCHDITTPNGKWKCDSPHGLYKGRVEGGYESYHLFDMSAYTFSFCEGCLRKLFNQCKIPPVVTELGFENTSNGNLGYADREELSWDDDQYHYEYRVWKDNGGHHQAYLDRKCNAKKDCPNKAVYTRLHNGDEDGQFTEECCCEEHKEVGAYSNSSLTKFIPNVLKVFL